MSATEVTYNLSVPPLIQLRSGSDGIQQNTWNSLSIYFCEVGPIKGDMRWMVSLLLPYIGYLVSMTPSQKRWAIYYAMIMEINNK